MGNGTVYKDISCKKFPFIEREIGLDYYEVGISEGSQMRFTLSHEVLEEIKIYLEYSFRLHSEFYIFEEGN